MAQAFSVVLTKQPECQIYCIGNLILMRYKKSLEALPTKKAISRTIMAVIIFIAVMHKSLSLLYHQERIQNL
jgi:hypothetical protein